jgi:hypothetical protein
VPNTAIQTASIRTVGEIRQGSQGAGDGQGSPGAEGRGGWWFGREKPLVRLDKPPYACLPLPSEPTRTLSRFAILNNMRSMGLTQRAGPSVAPGTNSVSWGSSGLVGVQSGKIQVSPIRRLIRIMLAVPPDLLARGEPDHGRDQGLPVQDALRLRPLPHQRHPFGRRGECVQENTC